MGNAEIVLGRRPIERHPLARPYLQRRTVGCERLFNPRRPAPPLAKPLQCIAKIVLGLRPVERHPLARVFPERRAVGADCLLEMRRPALPLECWL